MRLGRWAVLAAVALAGCGEAKAYAAQRWGDKVDLSSALRPVE